MRNLNYKKSVKEKSIQYSKHKKVLYCYMCNITSLIVDDNCVRVKCSKCLLRQIKAPVLPKTDIKSNRPKGWQFMNEFVDSDGTVFFKGKEQPKLKGKRPITDVSLIREIQKKNKKIKDGKKIVAEERKQQKLIKEYEKKKKIKKKMMERKNNADG